MEIERIAEICHEVNRGVCVAIGDDSQSKWEDAPEWMRDSSIRGVSWVAEVLADGRHPVPSASDSHDRWVRQKIMDGWVYGDEKNIKAKTHPCLVMFDELSIEQQLKDELSVTVASFLLSKGD